MLNDGDGYSTEEEGSERQVDEDEEDTEGESYDGSIRGHTASSPVHAPSESGQESDGISENEANEQHSAPQRPPPKASETEPPTDMTSSLTKTRESDTKKGQAVKRQIVSYSAFLALSF